MWLALDIGNSSTKAGLFSSEDLERTFKLRHRGSDVLTDELNMQLSHVTIEQVGICSVVPSRTKELRTIIGNVPFFEVTRDVHFPFPLRYKSLQTLGMDRLAAAAGAWLYHAVPSGAASAIVVDAGTAITIDVVTRKNGYVGGIITAGPKLIAKALHDGTDQLPLISPNANPPLIGQSTTESLKSGVVHGTVAMVQGLLNSVRLQSGNACIVLTGGWASRLHEHLSIAHEMDQHLVLRGIDALLRHNSRTG